MSFSKVGTVLLRTQSKDNTTDQLNSLYIITVGQEILKSFLETQWSEDIVVKYYKRGFLYIHANSPSVASFVKLREREFLNTVNEKIEKKAVVGIKFV